MFVRPDFADAAQVADLLAAHARHPDAKRRRVNGPWSDCPLDDLAPDLSAALTERVRRELANHYPHLTARLVLAPDYVAYTVMGVGASHHLHADNCKLDGTPNHTPGRLATAMLYLGSGGVDFRGGSILFPSLGLSVEPRTGMLVGFLCDLRHRHEVPKVTRGERHAIAFWFKEAK